MILESIKIKNFRGFAERKCFEFENSALIMLTAPNGKGKTSMMDAAEWCLTGDIKRIHEAFNRRNTNAVEKDANRGAILKNKKHLNELTTVELKISDSQERYTVVRTQEEDTLENKGKLSVNGLDGDEAECELEKIIDSQSFYKYHFCDMQKTYNFLNKSRGQLEGEFEDFSADYSEVENVVHNLNNYLDDIKVRISKCNKNKIAESTQKAYEDTIEKYQKSSDILPYDNRKIYTSENTELKDLTEEQLEDCLKKLYKCGYSHVWSLLEEKSKSTAARKRKSELEILKKELELHGDEIKEAIRIKAYIDKVRTDAETVLQQYRDIKLTSKNLKGQKDELFKIGSEIFSEQYWESSNTKLSAIKEDKKDLASEVDTLSKGNQIIDILTSITAGKNALIQYRTALREKQTDHPVLCPVCGSDQFDYLEEAKITQQAQMYQEENKELIEMKKRKINDLKKQESDILEEQLNNANLVLNAATAKADKEVNTLNDLYKLTKNYFLTQKKLQQDDPVTYSLKKMLSLENIKAEFAENEKNVFTDQRITVLDAEVQGVLDGINFSTKEEFSDAALLEEIRRRTEKLPEGIKYDEKLLMSKISSIRSYINNKRFLETAKLLREAKIKNERITEEIKGLQQLEKTVKKRINDINGKKDELKRAEYEQVGPYLYKFFCKLSRDVRIDQIRLENFKGGKASLLDEEKKSLLNTLSDGQLSVFMLSYFMGNIFRMKECEKLPVYFVDDITSCMDDINMLAFLDLIKYQLLNKESAIKQMFFATCDSRIQDMLEYKLASCNIQFKKIDSNEFAKLDSIS